MYYLMIRVYGNEHDLNREISKRGLFRVGTAYKEKGTIVCLVRSGNWAGQKCLRWFDEGNKPFDPAFPKRKCYSDHPGSLETLGSSCSKLWSPADRFLGRNDFNDFFTDEGF